MEFQLDQSLYTMIELLPGHCIARLIFCLLPLLFAAERVLGAQSDSGFALLGRGVNYGNMLEAPREGDWGAVFQDDYPRLIKQAEFDHVRIPVRWSAHIAPAAPFAVEPEFLARVKHVVDLNLAEGLKVVLDVHHFDELCADPAGQRERFLAIWQQLAEQFQHADERLFFELLNEPQGRLSGKTWNALVAEALQTIRQRNPERWIIVGPDQWNGIRRLPQLELPESDRRLIVTVHYYNPHAFTHQGAEWDRLKPPAGKKWEGSPAELNRLQHDFAAVASWTKEHARPVYLGEFGVYHKADVTSRVRWTRTVRKICEEAGFAWCYWELVSGFGILDPSTRQWRSELLPALLD